MRAYLGLFLCAAAAGLLQACGGGSGDPVNVAGEQVPVSTQFSINVDSPVGLTTAYNTGFTLINHAYADAQVNLTDNNFAIVLLDQVGNIYRQANITSWEKQSNGLYIIDANVAKRFNAVLLVDLYNTPDFTVGEPLPDNLLMAPLTASDVVVTLNSTMAYSALAKRVVQDQEWSIFYEVVSDPSRRKLAAAQDFVDDVGEELDVTLMPQIGTLGMRIRDLMTLSIVKRVTAGIIERKYSEQTGNKDSVEAVLNGGYWRLNSFASNDGSGINADNMQYINPITTTTEYDWGKDGVNDIALTEQFTYISENTTFTSNDIKNQVLTARGWVGLYNYSKVLLATSSTAMLTDAALTESDNAGTFLEVSSYSLAGKKLHDFLSTKENHHLIKYIAEGAVFEDGAIGYYFTWRPENERYTLCNNRNDSAACRISPIAMPVTFYTAVNDVMNSEASGTILNVNGFKLSDNVIVEFVKDEDEPNGGSVHYWFNIAGDNWQIQKTASWASAQPFGFNMIQFEVPEAITQLDNSYRFNTRYLFLVEDQGYVNIGETILDPQEFHYSGFNDAAKEQIFTAASRDNLPPFGYCYFGDNQAATEDKFLNAVIECGGDERFTTQSVSDLFDQQLVQIDPEGNIKTIILKENNIWEFYTNGVLQGSEKTWSLTEQGYLRLNWNPPLKDDDFDLWALTSRDPDNKLLAIKTYMARKEDIGAPTREIYTQITKEYAPDELAVCADNDSGWSQETTTPTVKKSLPQYQDQAASCMVTWDNKTTRFTEAMLIGQDGDNSDDMALTFRNDTSRYLRLSDSFSGDFFLGKYVDSDGCGFNFDIKWKINEDGTLYYEASDGSMNERITITESDGLDFAIKAFNHQTRWQTDETLQYTAEEGEIWSDTVTLIRASDVPDVEHNPDGAEPLAGGTILNDGQECELPPPPAEG
ncbi:hydrogenase expression protein HypA [Photobacterium lipolyticum]|uniref:Hydrogenase expression protein HypA n=1 Tax=Photobacterium lipolyticum TaxID=266810 RepID=A0A2T3N480_9GAMM|nr:hydrogenase expression protein HypA [Photobacterium lipolyticum]PSW07242.1 hydrogenase expression protein HypA [Photobacterium lipolyticum]